MFFPLSRFSRCCFILLLATCSLARPVHGADNLPSIESFFANPQFRQAQLSPSGKLLALVKATPGKRDGLVVIDLATMHSYSAASFQDVDIGNLEWVNERRLVFDVTDSELAPGETDDGSGLYAANYDGSDMRQLADRNKSGARLVGTNIKQRLLPASVSLARQPGAQNSDSVYVLSHEMERHTPRTDLLLLDTVSGKSTRVVGPQGTHTWLLDQQGEPRLVASIENQDNVLYYRDPGATTWRKLISSKLYTGSKGEYVPLAFGPEGSLYINTYNGKDKSAVHTLDIASGKISEEALIETAGYDFRGGLIMRKGILLGAHFSTDTAGTLWFDPAMLALQKEVDRQLSDTVNLISLARRSETPWLLVQAYSDVRPSSTLLYNTATKLFTSIGNTHPSIKPQQMGHQEAVSYKARDGLTIPALLTLPAGATGAKRAMLPLVVLVHGGPYVRGSTWGWDAQSQFLASRGYAVLEPSYRGTTGFGSAHYRAGWKQWGLAMQDDIADGAKWAIKQGLVDPKRICIAGASYGGYAALMGLVNDPGLYRCGVSWVGVTDIGLLRNGHWNFKNDMSELYRDYGLPVLVGDVDKDAVQLKATSPLAQAARITQPLLLAYGGSDRRVPQYHGNLFYGAVKQTNKDVEWIVYPDEAHGWKLPKNRIDFWSRVETFLDRNIGNKRSK